MTILTGIWGFLRGVPWQVYAGLALLAAFWIWGNHQYSEGRESVLVELRAAEAEAKEAAIDAAASADASERDRVADFMAEQEALSDVIEQAEKENGNALDAIF